MYGAETFRDSMMRIVDAKMAASLAVVLLLIILSYFFLDIPVTLYCKGLNKSIVDFFGIVTEFGISTWYLVGSFALFYSTGFSGGGRSMPTGPSFFSPPSLSPGLLPISSKSSSAGIGRRCFLRRDFMGSIF
jgi:hypothetical protein